VCVVQNVQQVFTRNASAGIRHGSEGHDVARMFRTATAPQKRTCSVHNHKKRAAVCRQVHAAIGRFGMSSCPAILARRKSRSVQDERRYSRLPVRVTECSGGGAICARGRGRRKMSSREVATVQRRCVRAARRRRVDPLMRRPRVRHAAQQASPSRRRPRSWRERFDSGADAAPRAPLAPPALRATVPGCRAAGAYSSAKEMSAAKVT